MTKSTKIESLTQFSTPQESSGYLLWRVSLAWRGFIEDVLKPLNLTHPQFVVLATTAWLTRKGTHINQIDISKTSGLDPNTVSQILRSLEIKKFVVRTRSLNERSKNPVVTEKGSKVLSKALPLVEKTDAQFFASLPHEEFNSLINTFQKLII